MVQNHAKQDITVNVGDRFPLTIRRLGVNGHGIGYFKHKVCFVPGALPGEVVVAEVTKVMPRFLEAKIHRLRRTSKHRVTPRDSYADVAGGFELENLAYPEQLKFKRQVVLDSLSKFKPYGYRNYDVRPTIAAPAEYGYRNKAQFQVRLVDGHVAAGLYKPDSHDLVDMQECAVQMPQTMHVMRTMVKLIEKLNIPVYDEEHNSGIIKTLAVRESWTTGELQLTIITNTPKLIHKHQLLDAIKEQLPEVVSVMQNVNPGDTPLVWGDQTIHLAGAETITESLMGLDFKLSARSFLQLNPAQTEVLYEEAAKALELSPDDTLIDAYAGIGTIGLSLASRVKDVRGMEIIPEAVDDANENARLNGITNAHYEVGKAEEILPKWQEAGLNFDALVVDPPRAGLDDNLIKAILKTKPRKFAYVSCGMASLARNLRRLTSVYHVDYIQPIDMMPQTARCEAVVKLSLRK
ncbi:MAG: 23S rRNA (uracil(1939)-C(5))-methyltransferase RlmD [Limosilactobacillus sp.]|uniref:23S rRNA (uracil(1939)-C(5))-methyltransferase RlmD n=1 Tax=Limosilactobacillus sp. TaxID=2773925 RepID=UPI002A760FD7|nr:23S rRNA (uracil(1939)-C(5))-methyltransferase RlmD [Limosilactobacillus sp.]MDD7692822.1 23S rRNA (uracil(1939)-C(5))-methyltransferase RlmD [Lactobacillaceae bacterium]MDY2803621.1 23S rRNA (uracil(1939)-C(5))-methyltransferase RlmD [Limosilactobacillus sp.]